MRNLFIAIILALTSCNVYAAQLKNTTVTGNLTVSGTTTVSTPFTLGAVSVLPTGTELNYVDGVTSAIQTQIDSKQGTLTNSTGLASALNDETGTGLAVFGTSPTFITPNIGAASATTINKVTITAPATASTLTIANGATLTASASATVSGTNTGDNTVATTGDSPTDFFGAGSSAYVTSGTDVAFADGGTGISSWTQYLIPYAATTTSIGQIAIGTSGQVLTSNGAGAAPTFQTAGGMQYTDTRYKVGSFTRDMSTASGAQSVTGVGFAPKAIIFFSGRDGGGGNEIGFDDGTNNNAWSRVTAGTSFDLGTTMSVYHQETTGGPYTGEINTFDADGFTINWTRNGAITGILTINYLALR